MKRIRVINVSKSFGVTEVFKHISFEIKHGDRIGLVGPNGAGKSTLLKSLMGLEEFDEGQVIKSDMLTIGYLEQSVNLSDDSLEEEIQKAWADVRHLETQIQEVSNRLATEASTDADLKRLAQLQDRMEWLGGYDYEAQCRRIAYGLGFTKEDLKKPAHEFSGGQKTRINLAKALVRKPDFLFLDEPTNHLDMQMLEWLESYLSSYGGGILIVSHDRYFLDQVATGIIELNHHKAITYKGNYSRYVALKEERLKAERSAYEKQEEYIRQTEAYIDKYRAGIKSKMARGRQSQLNRLERLDAPDIETNLQFTFPKPASCADKVLVLDKVSAGYADSFVFTDLSLMIRRGEAVALIGSNGAGKTTLVKAVMGDIHNVSGIIDIGNRVQIGYFSQEHEELHKHWTVLEEIMNTFNYSEEKARNVLGMFLFRGDDVFKLVGDLSGGEQARLSLLMLFLEGDNFLILDEPTNHLDIPTREVVEEALLQFGGTYLVISHDRYFLDKIAKRTISMENGKLTDYLGNYTYYKEKLHEKSVLDAQKIESEYVGVGKHSATKEEADSPSNMGSPYNQKPNKNKGTFVKVTNDYMREKELAKVETEIARLEATMKMYEVQLSDPTLAERIEEYEVLAKEVKATEEILLGLYEKWEKLSTN